VSVTVEDTAQTLLNIAMTDNPENGSPFEGASNGTTQTKPSSTDFDAGSFSRNHVDKAARSDEAIQENSTSEKDAKFDEVFAEYVQKYGRERVLEMMSEVHSDGKAQSYVENFKGEGSEMDLTKLNLPKELDSAILDSALKDLKIMKEGDKFESTLRCKCALCMDLRLKRDQQSFFSGVSCSSHPNT
jgi:hypothetical protein